MSNPVDDFMRYTRMVEQQWKVDNATWLTSPFLWLRMLGPSPTGAAGESIVKHWLSSKGFVPVDKRLNSGHDCVVQGLKIEIKVGTQWKGSGDFGWFQIRDQDYDVLLLVGIEPFAVSIYAPPKELAWEHAEQQQGGNQGPGCRKIQWRGAEVPEWIKPYGQRGVVSIEGHLPSMWHTVEAIRRQLPPGNFLFSPSPTRRPAKARPPAQGTAGPPPN